MRSATREYLSRLQYTSPGQALMEYALILALVSIGAVAALYFFGGGLNSLLGIGAAAAPH